MNFTSAIKKCYSGYATFSGRATRSEFWFFNLFFYLPLLVLVPVAIGEFISEDVLFGLWGIFALGNFLPLLSVTVRRLHDVNMSGWWLFIRIIPIVGDIYLLVKFCTRGDLAENNFGLPSELIVEGHRVENVEEEITGPGVFSPDIEHVEYKEQISPPRSRLRQGADDRSSGAKITMHVVGGSPVALRLDDELVIGRSAECDLPLPGDTMASKRHAALTIQRGILVLKDLGSSNGTFLNGSKINASEPIADGDCITVGRSEIRVAF